MRNTKEGIFPDILTLFSYVEGNKIWKIEKLVLSLQSETITKSQNLKKRLPIDLLLL